MIALYQPLSAMTRCFWQAAALGMGLAVLYDLLHAAVPACPAKRRCRDALPDLLFCFAALAAYFVFTVTVAGGQVRGFVLIGALGGFAGTHIILGRPVRAVVKGLWAALRFLTGGCVRLMRTLALPVCLFLRFGQKNLEKIAKRASISSKKKI